MFQAFARLIGRIFGSLNQPASAAVASARELRGQVLRAYKKTLMRGAVTGKDARVARRRFARDKTQKLAKLMRRGGSSRRLPKSVLLVRFRPSPILDALIPARETQWIPVMRRDRFAEEPEIELRNFSFVDYPRETLKAIKNLGEISGQAITAQLHFQDDYCVDIAPYLVLAEVWPAMANVFRGGSDQCADSEGDRGCSVAHTSVDAVQGRWWVERRLGISPTSPKAVENLQGGRPQSSAADA
jgi:hypothetical protein